jgi:hypothetical protein
MASIPYSSFSAVKVHETIKQQNDQQKKFGPNEPIGVSHPKCYFYKFFMHIYHSNLFLKFHLQIDNYFQIMTGQKINTNTTQNI